MNMSLITPIIAAVLGFIGGLLAPWVKWKIERQRLKRREQADAIHRWREAIEQFDFDEESFGNTSWYSSLRAHMRPEIIAKIERPRTVFVPGPRGGPVVKVVLLDEVSRLGKIMWGLH